MKPQVTYFDDEERILLKKLAHSVGLTESSYIRFTIIGKIKEEIKKENVEKPQRA